MTISYTWPRQVSHIRVKLMSAPRDFNREALAYLIYELNLMQESWYFDFDFDTFSSESLTPEEASGCEFDSVPVLCHAIVEADGQPFIGITSRPLSDEVQFCRSDSRGVTVITTADKQYEPLNVYEYLMYCVISQSIVTHLQLRGESMDFFHEQSTSHGGLFQFIPNSESIRASILTAHLSPGEQELLFNRFGPQYVSTCAKLLTLDWMRSSRVSANLDRVFKVKLPAR